MRWHSHNCISCGTSINCATMSLRRRFYKGESAQKCLSIDEISRIIVMELLEHGLLDTAAALGTTCRSLFHTTIPELWRTLQSAIPLLLLLPNEFMDVVKANMKRAYYNRDARKASPFDEMWLVSASNRFTAASRAESLSAAWAEDMCSGGLEPPRAILAVCTPAGRSGSTNVCL